MKPFVKAVLPAVKVVLLISAALRLYYLSTPVGRAQLREWKEI